MDLMEKYGLSIMPRSKPWLGQRKESDEEYNTRWGQAFRSHSLVVGYLETHDVPYGDPGFMYYDILRLALDTHDISWDDHWEKFNRVFP